MYSFSDLEKKGKLALITIVIIVAVSITFGVLSFMTPGGLLWIMTIPSIIIMSITGAFLYYKISEDSSNRRKGKPIGITFAATAIFMIIMIVTPYLLNRSWSITNYDQINKVEISGNGSKFAAITEYEIQCYDSNTKALLWEEYDTPSFVKLSFDGNYMIKPEGNYITLLDAQNGNQLFTYDTGGAISSAFISSDGSYYIALSSGDIFYFEKGDLTPRWIYNSAPISEISISYNGGYIIAKSGTNLYLFNSTSNVPMWSYNTGSTVNSIDISGNGNYFIAGCQNEYVYIFKKGVAGYLWNYQLNSYVTQVKISPNEDNAVAITERDDGATYLTIYRLNPKITNSIIQSDQWFNENQYTTFKITEDCLHLILGEEVVNTRTRNEAGPYYSTYSFLSGAIILASIDERKLTGVMSYTMYHYPTDIAISDDNSLVAYCGNPRAMDNPGYDGLYLYDMLLNTYVMNSAPIMYIIIGLAILTMVVLYRPKIKLHKKDRKKISKSESYSKYSMNKPAVASTIPNTKTCGQCGYLNKITSNFCRRCGNKLQEIRTISRQASSATYLIEKDNALNTNRCPFCNSIVPQGNAICWKCFNPIK